MHCWNADIITLWIDYLYLFEAERVEEFNAHKSVDVEFVYHIISFITVYG